MIRKRFNTYGRLQSGKDDGTEVTLLQKKIQVAFKRNHCDSCQVLSKVIKPGFDRDSSWQGSQCRDSR